MREKGFTLIKALLLLMGIALCFTLLSCSQEEDIVLYDLYSLRDFASFKEQTLWIDFGSPRFRKHLMKNWGEDEKLPNGRTAVWGLEDSSTLWFELLSPQDLAITFLCKPMPYKGAPSQSLKVIVNDHSLVTFNLASFFKEFRFYLPSSLLRKGVNYIQLVPKYSIAPQITIEGSRDTRRHSVCFDYLLLTPKEWHEKGFRFDLSPIAQNIQLIPPEKSETPEALLWVPGLWERSYYLKIPPYSLLKYNFGFATEEWDLLAPSKIEITVREEEGKEKFLGSVPFDPEALKSLKKPAEGTIDLSPYWDKVVKLTLRFLPDEKSGFNPAPVIYFHPRIIQHIGKEQRSRTQQKLAKQSESKLREIRRDCTKANVLIFVLDAAQASHLSCYGYHRKTTPIIDKLGKEGIVFLNGYCQAVYTRASTASLMTGWYPDAHYVLYPEHKLNDNAVTMAEMFQKSGYNTAAFVAVGNASSAFGFRQGFDYFYESFKQETYTAKAEDFLPTLLPWIEKHNSKPFFLYVHFREPHSFIDPPLPFTDMFDKDYQGTINPQKDRERIASGEIEMTPRDLYYIIATYDASICYADSVIGKIIDKLKSSGLYERTIIIIITDHGEALWEHGFFGHNTHLYEEISHIPFIIKLPTSTKMGDKKSEALVQTIDLLPTLVDILQLSSHNNVVLQGKSLLPLMAGSISSVNDLLYFRTVWRKPRYGVRDSVYKYIIHTINGDEELYNLRDDPQERRNLMESSEIIENYFRQQFSIWLHQQRYLRGIFRGSEGVFEIDEATLKNLKALGYITN